MGITIKDLKASMINFLMYRKLRDAPYENLKDDMTKSFRTSDNRLTDMKRIVTKHLLNSMGLDISDSKSNIFPKSVYLTKMQKRVIFTVNKAGFRAKLLNY